MSDDALRLTLLPSGLRVRLPRGERLLDALDELGSPSGLPTACRAGNCVACLVRVVTGAATLADAEPRELDTLRKLGVSDLRLGCQVRAAPAPAAEELVLEVIGQVPSGPF